MILNEKYKMTKSKDGTIWHNITYSNDWSKIVDKEQYDEAIELLSVLRKKNISSYEKQNKVNAFLAKWFSATTGITKDDCNKLINIEDICSRLMKFFGDFQFQPNFRFINTLQKQNQIDTKHAISYVVNYFELTGNPELSSVKEKCNSYEFKQILNDMTNISTTNTINKRFKLMYGPQGTGKTTKAMEETSIVMVCHSGMLPADLLEDFKFNDGKPGFHPSALWKAMEEGTKIVLDEINLLPFESLRFLQTILDNKTEITYKGTTINIREGFEIIGTMNLYVNGDIFTLPEPLVDRCQEITSLQLTAHDLVGALL